MLNSPKKNKYLITAALPYANGMLHFGHIAGSYLPADCYARFRRMNQDEVLFISGSDEYGIAVALSAEQAKRTPQEQVNYFHAINKQLFNDMNISFDYYGRTTSPTHHETTKEFFLSLLENGHLEEKFSLQLYSEADQKFLADRYVEGECPRCHFDQARGDECPQCGASFEAVDLIRPRSKLTKAPLQQKMTKHFFLRFDHFKEQLRHFLAEKNWKPNVEAFAKHYVDELRERAITRDTSWGIPVPAEGFEEKVFYVWFDAPIGYISIAKDWAKQQPDPECWKDFWCDPETRLVQFLGKDNIPFHAVFFPAMIMGQDRPYKLVDDLPANEFYHLDGKQFSKSSGWTIDLGDFLKKFSPDMIRYVIASNAPENSDAEFNWNDFQQRVNSDLVGKYGNLVNRILTFIHTKMGGQELFFERLDELDHEMIEQIEKLSFDMLKSFEEFKLRKAASLLMELASCGNAYFDSKKPWALYKDVNRHDELKKVLALCLYILKALALVSYPIIPQTAALLWDLLGYEEPLAHVDIRKEIKIVDFNSTTLKEPVILFKKVEDAMIQQEIDTLKPPVAQVAPSLALEPLSPMCTIQDVQQIDLRVGQILDAVKVEKSKKLLKLTVDIGLEVRTIVSGIALHVTDPASLIGKKVMVVANLQPAQLMGIESQGMLLAGSLDNQFEIPSIGHLKNGTRIS